MSGAILSIHVYLIIHILVNFSIFAGVSTYPSPSINFPKRAPELLYGARKYDEGVDLWAVGCIFGELLNNSPLFPGENDIEQLCCVLRVLGTPTEETWPGMTELPDFNKITFPENPPMPFEEILPDASPEAIDLVRQFLVYPSKQRISAKKALLHPYFFTGSFDR